MTKNKRNELYFLVFLLPNPQPLAQIYGSRTSIYFMLNCYSISGYLFVYSYQIRYSLIVSTFSQFYQFSSNLPAPINVGSTQQTKTGNLIIEGVLRLGQFTTTNAPSGTDGALYFDTTENTTKLYSNSAWGDLSGGWDGVLPNYTTAQRDALSPSNGMIIYNTDLNQVQIYSGTSWSGITGQEDIASVCDSGMDCASGFCVDGFCCNNSCPEICEACNLAGTVGTCTVRPADDDGGCAVCQTCDGTSHTVCKNYINNTQDTGCTGTCLACQSGICGIADSGTDPGDKMVNDLTCSITSGSCSNTTVFKMYSATNSHAELTSQANYTYYACCSGITGLGTSCSGNYDTVLKLYSSTNSHVEKSTELNYGNSVCLSLPEGTNLVCDYASDCANLGPDYACVASISGDTNAHVGNCDNFSIKVCCANMCE